jgi:hypothetical protein
MTDTEKIEELGKKINRLAGAIKEYELQLKMIEQRKKSVIVFNISRIPNDFIHVIFEALEENNEVVITPTLNDIEIRWKKDEQKN